MYKKYRKMEYLSRPLSLPTPLLSSDNFRDGHTVAMENAVTAPLLCHEVLVSLMPDLQLGKCPFSRKGTHSTAKLDYSHATQEFVRESAEGRLSARFGK
jgi:hypothetical protein